MKQPWIIWTEAWCFPRACTCSSRFRVAQAKDALCSANHSFHHLARAQAPSPAPAPQSASAFTPPSRRLLVALLSPLSNHDQFDPARKSAELQWPPTTRTRTMTFTAPQTQRQSRPSTPKTKTTRQVATSPWTRAPTRATTTTTMMMMTTKTANRTSRLSLTSHQPLRNPRPNSSSQNPKP
ncbi:hypothetical protein SNOG_14091 [Parastagonospora nodorum SN15]|uniref:Uncharacterized protein n=1 Tax=Phaeosphaeria nodorum (strain SN15 / ATCC MYA-4574 / FGSC 10173) TaxID=321614 RepID=Q0U2E2_PHANO|nr:hypothetical protein SNOG_14091 [Parastagonospora nodorum SN15]EAT78716.2 hypothetical protein SNOG_14091 [Parastagonospora nodorum SN15]